MPYKNLEEENLIHKIFNILISHEVRLTSDIEKKVRSIVYENLNACREGQQQQDIKTIQSFLSYWSSSYQNPDQIINAIILSLRFPENESTEEGKDYVYCDRCNRKCSLNEGLTLHPDPHDPFLCITCALTTLEETKQSFRREIDRLDKRVKELEANNQ